MANEFELREIDPETGLYRLPKGYFWKVSRFRLSESVYTLRVRLMKRHRLWFPTEYTSSLASSSARSVLNAAQYAFHSAFIRQSRVRAQDAETRAFLGTYPPKKIGVERV